MKHLAQIQAEFLKIAMDWRDKFVMHTTPSGQRNRVKIKSLTPEEQEKYKPAYEKIDKIIQAGVAGSNLLKTMTNIAEEMTPAAKATFAKTLTSIHDALKKDSETYKKMIRNQLMSLREKNDHQIIALKKAKLVAKSYTQRSDLQTRIEERLGNRQKFDQLIRNVPAPRIKEPKFEMPTEEFDPTDAHNMRDVIAKHKGEISDAIDKWINSSSPEIVDKKTYMILADAY